MNRPYGVTEKGERDQINFDREEKYDPALEAIFSENVSHANSFMIANNLLFSDLAVRQGSSKLALGTPMRGALTYSSETLTLAKGNRGDTEDLTRDIGIMLRGGIGIGQSIKFTVQTPQLGLINVSAVNHPSAFLVNIRATSLVARKILKSRDQMMAKQLEGRVGKRVKLRVSGQ